MGPEPLPGQPTGPRTRPRGPNPRRDYWRRHQLRHLQHFAGPEARPTRTTCVGDGPTNMAARARGTATDRDGHPRAGAHWTAPTRAGRSWGSRWLRPRSSAASVAQHRDGVAAALPEQGHPAPAGAAGQAARAGRRAGQGAARARCRSTARDAGRAGAPQAAGRALSPRRQAHRGRLTRRLQVCGVHPRLDQHRCRTLVDGVHHPALPAAGRSVLAPLGRTPARRTGGSSCKQTQPSAQGTPAGRRPGSAGSGPDADGPAAQQAPGRRQPPRPFRPHCARPGSGRADWCSGMCKVRRCNLAAA